jgi:DnaJ like chaperone protein
MELGQIIQSIVGLSFDFISILFKLFLAFVAATTAFSKGRSAILWGIITFIFPWTFLIIMIMPRKYPRFTSSLNDKEEFRGRNPVVASIMALAAMIAKSDGSVSREEVNLVKQFVSMNFRLSQEELRDYGEAFDYGKNHPEAYKEFTQVITSYYYRRTDVILAISYLFVAIGIQDSNMTGPEEAKIKAILFELGVNEYEFNSIKNSFNRGGGYSQNNAYSRADQTSLVKKYSEILGVDENATMSEVKKAYRKLVKEYHPDKIASQGMPKEYEDFANQKVSEINEAYEYLKKIKEAE